MIQRYYVQPARLLHSTCLYYHAKKRSLAELTSLGARTHNAGEQIINIPSLPNQSVEVKRPALVSKTDTARGSARRQSAHFA